MSDNPYSYGVAVEDLVKRYRQLYSGAIYDVLDEEGLPHQALAPDLKPVRSDMVVAGPAFTLKGIPDSTGNENLRSKRIHMFGDMKATGVPLIDVRDCSFDTQAAHYGEMNAVVGKSCGVIGAVVDGGCRDTGFLLRDDFPVFCRYQSPVEAYRRWSYYEWQQPVALRGALSAVVPVHPGDFLFGDLDGVVVVPAAGVVDVLEKCERLVGTENETRALFASGEDPVAVYKQYGRL
ncbi:RraA family protein [Streptomyces sp. NPDC060194]|uniref:RraA family protein n=1 Tax=Streptomyces sp. NPDC060194 TaxID=3347069 RepID=UPI00365B46A0